MKYFVITDIHSFYYEMISALEKSGFEYNNPNHVLISCGDLLDRGNNTIDVLRYINGLPKERKILVKGNHEELLTECLNRKEFYQHDFHKRILRVFRQGKK